LSKPPSAREKERERGENGKEKSRDHEERKTGEHQRFNISFERHFFPFPEVILSSSKHYTLSSN
jgi:hypothetical protein